MASISSDGGLDSQIMEQEDIAVLTHDVRNFKEALGKLRRTLNPDQESHDPLRVVAHERLGDVMRILRSVLDKYPALQSPEMLLSASTLIQHLKNFGFDDKRTDCRQFFELIDQLALAFSSRVSEYLMGDLDTNVFLTNADTHESKSNKHSPQDQLQIEKENYLNFEKKEDVIEQIDEALLNLEQGVEIALNRAKAWSKYVKDILMYIEKRCFLELEYTRNLKKLAQTVRSLIKEEANLPFQSIYTTALDYDVENSNSSQSICSQLLGTKFLEPLSERRSMHEKERRQLKEQWFREVSQMRDFVLSTRQDRNVYIQLLREADQKGLDEASSKKVAEAELVCKGNVTRANEGHKRLLAVKNEILQKIRNLFKESDLILQSATLAYFQLQHTRTIPSPVQFHTLYESTGLYEPGSQYLEAVKQLIPSATPSLQTPFTLEKLSDTVKQAGQEMKSTDSLESDDIFVDLKEPGRCSDNDSVTSVTSCHDAESSSSAGRNNICNDIITQIVDPNSQTGVGLLGSIPNQRHSLSKAAESHAFRKLKTPSRCRECDSYVYFQGFDCSECGLACHKKCLETLAIQCGHKRLPRKMTTFGVDLAQHLTETLTLVPHIVCKCIDEIDSRGKLIKGIYRVSGVKSKVEKLCQAFENGAELVDLTNIHPNVIANVLKLYLRQLPEPLLSFRLYPEFIRIAKDYPSNTSAELKGVKEELKELMKKLPSQHFLTLATLTLHLKRISNYSEVNNMPPSNLGIVFGPTLLRTAEGSASLSSLVDTIHQTRTIELLIIHANDLFCSQDVAIAKENSLKMVHSNRESGLLSHSLSFVDRNKKCKDNERTTNVTDVSETTQNIGNLSDDELSYFLCMDDPSKTKISSQMSSANLMPKIFKGSLKDYQGLEGLSSLGTKSFDNVDNSHLKLRKSFSDTSKESSQTDSLSMSCTVAMKRDGHEKVLACSSEEWYYSDVGKPMIKRKEISKSKSSSNRAESSADSDYSFESCVSSMERHAFRELEDSNEVFLELPESWTKKRNPAQNCSERQVLESGDSPFSSLSQSLDESQGSDFTDDMDYSSKKCLTHLHSTQTATQLFNIKKQDQGGAVYIPVLQKQEQKQESSYSKQQSLQSKSNVTCSIIVGEDFLTTLNNEEERSEVGTEKKPIVISSALATIEVLSHCIQNKSSQFSSDDAVKLNQMELTQEDGKYEVREEDSANCESDDFDAL